MVSVSQAICRSLCFTIAIALLLLLADPRASAQQVFDEDYFADGVGLYNLGQYDRAIPALEVACSIDHDNARAHYYLANCFMKLFQVSNAIGEYETCLQLNPDATTAAYCRQALTGLGYGTAARPASPQRLFRTAGTQVLFPQMMSELSRLNPHAPIRSGTVQQTMNALTTKAPAAVHENASSTADATHANTPKLTGDKLKQVRTGLGYQVAKNATTGIITSVTPGGPAWFHGLRPGDELVSGDIELSRDATAHLVVKHHGSTHTSSIDVVAEGIGARIESEAGGNGTQTSTTITQSAPNRETASKSTSVAQLPSTAAATWDRQANDHSLNNAPSVFKLTADQNRLAGQTAEDDLMSRIFDGKQICILIDSSASMNTVDCGQLTRWQWCQQQVQNLGNHIEKALPKPAQILVFSDGVHDYGMLRAADIAPVFEHNKPHGGTYLGNALETPLEQYRLQPYSADKQALLILVITDGEPSDGDHVRTSIAQAILDAREEKAATPEPIQTIFFCIGNDRHGQRYLAGLHSYIERQTGMADAIRIVTFDELQKDGLLHCLLSTVAPQHSTETADAAQKPPAPADTKASMPAVAKESTSTPADSSTGPDKTKKNE